MSERWHDNDWLVSLMAGLMLVGMIIGNYSYNGRLVW